MSDPLILALMTVLFLIFGYMGVPVAFSLMAGVLVGATFTDVSMPAIIQKIFDGMDNEALLAIPFFLLVGELMSSADVITRVARLALALVGHIRGGLSQVVTVFQHDVFGNVGLDDRRRRRDQPRLGRSDEARGLRSAIHRRDHRRRVDDRGAGSAEHHGRGLWRRRQRLDRRPLHGGGAAGLHDWLRVDDLLLFLRPGRPAAAARVSFDGRSRDQGRSLSADDPVILMGGILTGWFTPTEAGAVAVVWIIFAVIPVLNRGHLKILPYDFCVAGLIFSLPLITIGAANAFGWMLAYLRGALVIADWITSIAGSDPHLIMLLMVVLFTIIGDFIEPVPTIIIFMPMVNTLTQAGNINPVHMGVVLIATLAFGLITPPYGLVLLMASKFVGVRFSQALRAALPIYVVFLVTISFAIYFPKAVLWLPKQVIPASVGCFKSPSGAGYICPP